MHSINSRAWSTGGIDPNDYYEFGVSTVPNFELDLTSLEFTERRSATAIRTIDIRSSLDGFASSIFMTVVPDNTANRRQVVGLGASFQDLTAATFRLYGYNAEGSLGTTNKPRRRGDSAVRLLLVG